MPISIQYRLEAVIEQMLIHSIHQPKTINQTKTRGVKILTLDQWAEMHPRIRRRVLQKILADRYTSAAGEMAVSRDEILTALEIR